MFRRLLNLMKTTRAIRNPKPSSPRLRLENLEDRQLLSITLLNPITSTTSATPDFQWTDVPNAFAYKVAVTQGSRTVFNVPLTLNDSLTPSSPLAPGPYQITVTAVDGWLQPLDSTGAVNFTITTPDPSLTAPAMQLPTGTTTNPQPTLLWTPDPNAAFYNLVITKDGQPYRNQFGIDNSYTPNANLPAGNYQATVQGEHIAITSGGAVYSFTPLSNPLSFTIATPASPPVSPPPASLAPPVVPPSASNPVSTPATSVSTPTPSKPAPAPEEIGVARPNAAGVMTFSLDTNGKHSFDGSDPVFTFGLAGDIIVTGDWNGDGKTKLGVGRPDANGALVWSLDTNGDGTFDAGDQVFTFGRVGDIVVTGDWNGDGRTKLGVGRPDVNGALVWTLDTNGDGVFDAGDQIFTFGRVGDWVITGDWNGDGKTKLGVARPGSNGALQITLDSNGDHQYDPADAVFTFGLAGDQLITGDWNGDGRTKLGVARPNGSGALTVSLDSNGNLQFDPGDAVFTFGATGDILVSGKFSAYAGSMGNSSGGGNSVTTTNPIPPTQDNSFNQYVAISNVKGTWTGPAQVTIPDNWQPGQYKTVTATVTLTIDAMNVDPNAPNGYNFQFTGTLRVAITGYTDFYQNISGTYSVVDQPTVFSPQTGTLQWTTPNYNDPNATFAAFSTGMDVVGNQIQDPNFSVLNGAAYYFDHANSVDLQRT